MSDTLPLYDPQSGSHEPLQLLHVFLSCRMTASDATEQENNDLSDVFRVGDFLFGGTFEGALSILDASLTLVTRVTSAPSQRTAYLVTSSGRQTATYLCLIPTTSKQRNTSPINGVYYCSCRSFMEKNSRTQFTQPCKHLLALVLLPHVGAKCNTIETLTDEEFGRLLVNRGSPS